MFEDLSRDGRLNEGKKKLTKQDGVEWSYTGQIDENGAACGNGIATRTDGKHEYTYIGSFFNDQWEGIGHYSAHEIDCGEYMPLNTDVKSEFKEGEYHGL